RACDDAKEAIHADAEKHELRDCKIVAIHKKRLVYVKDIHPGLEPSVDCLSPNVVVVNTPHYIDGPIVTENSPLMYFLTDGSDDRRTYQQLVVLDMKTTEIASFELGDEDSEARFVKIIGLRDGILSFRAEWRLVDYIYNTEHQIEAQQFEKATLKSD
ncbi:hypothetical protein PFISCL1PPCAC_17234, partial [Pristionchus fissidentatus]